MKKFNILYVFILIAMSIVVAIVVDLQAQLKNTYFGTAETSNTIINLNFKAIINKIMVGNGDYVHKGDTVFTYYLSDLEKDISEFRNKIQISKTANKIKIAELNKQEENFLIQYQQDSSKIVQKKELIQLEIQNEAALRKKLGYEQTNNTFIIQKNTEINQLVNDLKNLKIKFQTQKRQLQRQYQSIKEVEKTEISQQQNLINFYTKHQNITALIASQNGFIENLKITHHEAIEPQQELGKITTEKPNYVVGFIPETMHKTNHIHQKIFLKSVARPTIMSKGVIKSIGNKIIELPLRLRKFPEIKAYGKEIFIEIPQQNQFYINEKLLISATPFN